MYQSTYELGEDNKKTYIEKKVAIIKRALSLGDLPVARGAVSAVRAKGWELEARRLEANYQLQ